MNLIIDNAIRFSVKELGGEATSEVMRTFRVKSPEYEKSDNKRDFSADDKYILMYDKQRDIMTVPRGCIDELTCILEDYGIEYDIVDKRLTLEEVDFPETSISFYKHQQKIIRKGFLCTQGTFEAGCGSGKTIALIGLIMKCRQPALIIVPDKTLQQQWIRNICDALGFEYAKDLSWFDDRIGMIGDGVYEYKDCMVTVAINASIYSHLNDKELFRSFGFVAMDEAHMVGARTFRSSIHLFPAKYRFGATATPFRTDNLTWFIEAYCGRKFCVVTDDELEDNGLLIRPTFIPRETSFKFDINFNYRNWYTTLTNYLTRNLSRNRLIVHDIIENSVKRKRLALVVSTSVNHCNYIARMLQEKVKEIRMGFLTDIRIGGIDYNCIETRNVESKAREGEIDVVFGVNRVRQGLDIPPIEDIYSIAPRKSQVDVTQIIGRCMRPDTCFGKYENKNDKEPCVYDYVDSRVPVLYDQYRKYRLPIYKRRCNFRKE